MRRRSSSLLEKDTQYVARNRVRPTRVSEEEERKTANSSQLFKEKPG